MLFLDAFIKIAGAVLLLLMASVAWRDVRRTKAAKYFIAMCISVAALELSLLPNQLGVPEPFKIAFRIFSAPNLIFIWLFGLSFFDDTFRLKLWHWLAVIIFAGFAFPFKFYQSGLLPGLPHWIENTIDVLALVLLVYLLFVTLRGRADDLIESRRRLRLYLLIALIIVAALTTSLGFLSGPLGRSNIYLIHGFIAFPMILWSCLWFIHMSSEKFEFESGTQDRSQQSTIDPRDAALRDKLIKEMEQRKAYLEPELTIRKLAENLSTPEHRLRALINQGMGYRNFSTFVNSYRIQAVKEAFADPDKTRIPILTLVMDAGFNSLAPFNRAFKASEKITPTAYRQNLLSKTNQK